MTNTGRVGIGAAVPIANRLPVQPRKGIVPNAAIVLAALCLLSLTGCSAFERNWHAAECYPTTAGGLDGRWEGCWHSDFNGHQGKLRAVIVREGENQYCAHFKATYLLILPFEFSIPLYVTESGGVHTFQGQADLGFLAGGVFTYCGQADACRFHADFCAKRDYGTFTMTRIVSCGESIWHCDSGSACGTGLLLPPEDE
jgi:hypothetical protein